MGQNKEQLKKLLDFIDELAKDKGNAWFVEELAQRYSPGSSIQVVANDVKSIRDALHIKADNSIKYEYIDNAILRNQLLVDNLRMENYALDYQTIDETERFYYFCLNAFFQVENMLNYYFYLKYKDDMDALLTHIEECTKSTKYPFKRRGNEISVGDVAIEKKISSFCYEHFPYSKGGNDFTLKTLSDLRQVRNEGLHRCSIIKEEKNEKLYEFFKYQDFNTIRALLKKVSAKIEEQLRNRLINF